MGIFGAKQPVQLVARKDHKNVPGHNQALDEIMDTKVVNNNAEVLRQNYSPIKVSKGVASPSV